MTHSAWLINVMSYIKAFINEFLICTLYLAGFFSFPPNPKITFVAFGLCVCVSVTSITEKQITAASSNLACYICTICEC